MELEANGKNLAGDFLSPLLFCICLNPLSNMLEKTPYGYQFKNGTKINHLFYMNDIKLYTNEERNIDSLIHLTQVYSIGMTFDVLKMPNGTIKDIEERYKYLGIIQSNIDHEAETVKEEEQSIKADAASMATSDKLVAEFQSASLTMELRPDDEEIDWHMKPLDGAYHRQVSEVDDIHQTYMWLNKENLLANTESLLMAAQEQVLPKRKLQTKIYHTRDNARCRLCKDAPESIQHIISRYKRLAGNAYTERYNQVAGVVYRSLCDEYGLNKLQHWWEAPRMVNENDLAKILCNFYIRTGKHILANQPDIVVVDKENRRATTIYVVVPNDYNIASQE
ncbi:uncharacterized protein [Watersipora subatra]|uniref:uncharacterized protein n=1 Tax=Watersipora subatra TaxID=2589382 RepID=UPI00355C560D